MKTKPYPQIEEKPIVANEPAVAYGNIKREKLSPYTIEEIHVSMDETEADLIAGKVYSHDDVMRFNFPFIGKIELLLLGRLYEYLSWVIHEQFII